MSRIEKSFSYAVVFAAGLAATLSADASHYSTAVLLDNPVAYYRLNETTGNVAANLGTGTGIDGTYVNIPGGGVDGNNSLYGEEGPRPTSFNGFEANNNSVFFDPSTSSTTFPRVATPVANSSSPLAITGAITLEAWVKRSPQAVVASQNEGIVGRYLSDGDPDTAGTQPGRAYVLYFDSGTDGTLGTPDNTPGFGLALSSSGAFQSANSYEFAADVPVGEWVHVAAVFDPGQRIEMYVNGTSVGKITTGVLNDPLFSGMADLWIGQQFNGTNQFSFEGSIDEVAIYAAALTDAQVKAHYDAAFIPEPMTLQLAFVAVAAFLFRLRRKG